MQKKITNKLFAGLLSVLTAFSPALSVIPVYADTDDDNDGIDVQKVDDGISISAADEKTVSIELNGFDGELIIDEGKSTEQTVRVSESDSDSENVSVTDADGNVTMAEVNSENPYALVLTREEGSVATVQAKADSGYEVSQYSILIDGGAVEKTEFKTDTYEAFTYDVEFDANKVITVGFGTPGDGVELISNVDDGISIETEENKNDEEIEVESETETDESGITVDDTEEIEVEEESEVTPDESESETEDDQIVIEAAEPADTFVSVYLGDEVVDDEYNASDFASKRLVVLTDGDVELVNDGDVIGHYENYYLLQFTSIQQTMNAYVYYKDKVEAVEPDMLVEQMVDDSDESEIEVIGAKGETDIEMEQILRRSLNFVTGTAKMKFTLYN